MTDRWREVYEREYPRLVRALLAIGRDPAAAEDAAQEAFVKAHKTGLDNIEKLPGWLLVVGAREVFRKASEPAARPRSGHRYRLVTTASTPRRTASTSLPRWASCPTGSGRSSWLATTTASPTTRSPTTSRSRAGPSARPCIRRSNGFARSSSPAGSREERCDDQRTPGRRDPRARARARDRDDRREPDPLRTVSDRDRANKAIDLRSVADRDRGRCDRAR